MADICHHLVSKWPGILLMQRECCQSPHLGRQQTGLNKPIQRGLGPRPLVISGKHGVEHGPGYAVLNGFCRPELVGHIHDL